MAGRSEGVSTPGVWQKVRAASAWPVWVYCADCTVIFNLMGVFRRKSVMHGPAAGRSPSKIESPTWGILEKGTRCSGNGSLQAFGMSENCHPPFITGHIWLFKFLWWCSPHISFCPYKAPPCDLIHFELLFCGEWACRFSSVVYVSFSFFSLFFYLSALFHDWQRALLVNKTIFHLYALCLRLPSFSTFLLLRIFADCQIRAIQIVMEKHISCSPYRN